MPIASVYLNLEDDVAQVTARIKRLKAEEIVLVCPKKCLLFNDSINLKLLKKQVDLLGKRVAILTMDERGQQFAKEAGFELRNLPKKPSTQGVSDIQSAKVVKTVTEEKPMRLNRANKDSVWADFIGGASAIKEKVHNIAVPTKKSVKTPPTAVVSERPATRTKPVRPRRRYALSGMVVIILVALLLVTFVILPRGEVVVYARSEPITRDMEISASSKNSSPDPDRLALPATKIAEIMDVTQKFQSTGKKEVGNPASGNVQIYNFTKLPINLKAETTTLTVGNKTYVLTADAMGIKPTVYSNLKTKEVDSASLSAPVEVVASQGGETYNLPAGTRMEITNKVFGSKPQLLYAKTTTAITGGTSRFLSFITDTDITSARDTLGQSLLQQERDKLSQTGLVLPDKAFTIEQQDFGTDQPVNTETPSFQAHLKAKITGLVVNKNDLNGLIENRIKQTLSDSETLDESASNLTYTLKSIDLNAESAVMEVHFEGKGVWKIDLTGVAQQLAGKSPTEASELLKSRPEIDRIDVTLSPAWQKNFPWFSRNIKFKIVQ